MSIALLYPALLPYIKSTSIKLARKMSSFSICSNGYIDMLVRVGTHCVLCTLSVLFTLIS